MQSWPLQSVIKQPKQDNTFRIAVKRRIEESAKGRSSIADSGYRSIKHVKDASKQHQQTASQQPSLRNECSCNYTQQQTQKGQRIRSNTCLGQRPYNQSH